MKRYILFYLGICLFSSLSGNNHYIFERISPPDGFAFSNITSIAEDENGFIWFSTSRLYYYNNYELKEYSLFSDSLSGKTTLFNNIYHDGHSNLWVCADDGLFLFDEVEDKFVYQELRLDPPLSSGISVSSILWLEDDKYILLANKRIYLYNKTRGSLEEFSPDVSFKADLDRKSVV